VATWDPPTGLDFLRTVPELRGISLEIREQEFLTLIKNRGVRITADRSSKPTGYWVTTPSGENIIVMFNDDGSCGGIQRMQPTPRPPRAPQH
jgi:hypothetical protein